MKKIIALLLVVAMTAAASVAGTIAYLQDSDSDVNVMTVGNVYIEQIEQERDANGNLVPFTQGKPALPVVGPIEWATTGNGVVVNGTEYKVFTPDLKNVVDKIVTVKNTGRSDAYVRTIVAIEAPNYDPDDLIHVNVNATGVTNTNWAPVDLDGIKYVYSVSTYADALEAKKTSVPSMMQVFLDSKADNTYCEAFGDTWDILVLSQAVQTAGFDNADTALDTAFGAADATNVAVWFGADDLAVPAVVDDADGLVKALESGEDVVMIDDVKIEPAGMSSGYGTTGINVKNGQTINGNGNTLTVNNAWSTWDSAISTTGGTIRNVTIDSAMRGIFINHNSTHSEPVILENVIIDGPVYTISCDQGMNQTFKATNSTFNGWTSYAADLGKAEFINCSFGEGSGYAFCRPYAPTSFVGCEFEAGYTVDPRAACTFENCTLNGVAITADNLATLVTAANLNNATVK